jgi:hypothetical protein
MYHIKVLKIFNLSIPSGLTVKLNGILTTPKQRRFASLQNNIVLPFKGELKILETW